ncbi:hypothetical protein HDU79_005058 [Rhizoclosmatium sp. JEL0117]|nr:hypothetical protein HDU79_005058 [Rhizoclosmatium sp. JEL0117]
MLECADSRWRDSAEWRVFLALDSDAASSNQPQNSTSTTTASTSTSIQFTSNAHVSPADWLAEARAVAAECRTIREAITQKDVLATQGNTAAMHAALAQIRASIKSLADRMALLDDALLLHITKSKSATSTTSSIGASNPETGATTRISTLLPPQISSNLRGPKPAFQPLTPAEIHRREDQLVNLKEEKDRIIKLFAASPQTVSQALASNSSLSASNARSELLSGQTLSASSSNAATPTPRGRRAFGASIQPKETDQTINLDNQGLLLLQNQVLRDQDNALESISTVIQRQKQIGQTMGDELELQNQMLAEMSEELDRVGGNLKHAGKKLDKLTGGSNSSKKRN